MQVPSPAAGVIEELLVPDGGKVEGGTPLFKLRKGGFTIFYFFAQFLVLIYFEMGLLKPCSHHTISGM